MSEAWQRFRRDRLALGALGVILLLVSLAIVVAYNRILTRLSGEQGMA